MSKHCGNSSQAHLAVMMERISIDWEALTERGENLRDAENYLTNYNAVTNPVLGKYTPRPFAFISMAFGAAPGWQAKRLLENKVLKTELQSPASFRAMFAGIEGASEALADFFMQSKKYDCDCEN